MTKGLNPTGRMTAGATGAAGGARRSPQFQVTFADLFFVQGSDQPHFETVARFLDQADHLVMGRPLDLLFIDGHNVVSIFHSTVLEMREI